MRKVDLMVKRGDTAVFNVAAVDNTGVAISIAGAAFWFTVKNSVTDPDPSKVFQKTLGDGITIISATAGQLRVTVAPTDTSALPSENVPMIYDLQMKDNTNAIWTINEGAFMVTPDVTRATS